jgi:hypothetical protein
VTDGARGYILTGTTLAEITDTDFPVPSSLTFQDGYFIVSQSATGNFFISTLYDGTQWDALDYGNAEGEPDNLQCVVSSNRELWLVGQRSYEVWYNSGVADFPFERYSGTFIRIGTDSPNTVCEHQGVVCWLDNFRFVRASQGYMANKISTPQIDYQISQFTSVSDATAFMYSQEGHSFYVLTFPTDNKTLVYDFTTGYWHSRASDSTDLRHRANCVVSFNGDVIVGDYDNGNLYKYSLSKYTDNGVLLRKIRSAQTIHIDRRNIFHHKLEVEFEAGVGLAVDDPDVALGEDPQAVLYWSDDDGHTWSSGHTTGIGLIGQYKRRAIWRRLGVSRSRIYKVLVSDPVKVVMISAHIEVSPGN